MSHRVLKTATLLAFATLSALAIAADPPARVGRVALAQGQVSIGDDVGAEMNAAQVNWPVTSGNMISTAPGARTEVRIGSTSIRLDGDASLEVTELDDDRLRLRLFYGSASVRVRNPDLLAGFELVTPQARIRLQQPGLVRVDAERVRDTSSVDVFEGVAEVEGGGSQLTLRAGKRAELTPDDVRTLAALHDGFDDWSAARDKAGENVVSARYVDTEMTGYEDLDRYGSWRVDNEYGPLWTPTVAATWVPYRDGSWTWLDPWGWTWVDNAPWGYAPFHYGRWVQVNQRWAWAPGRRAGRPVWSPALVGWIGGAGWNATFRDRSRHPAFGWYPLTPHDRFVPGWRAPDDHVRRLNSHVRPAPKRGRDYRPQGLTVVPQDRFRQPGRVNVARAPIASTPPVPAQDVPVGAPPAPPDRPRREGRPQQAEQPDRPGAGFVNRPERPDRTGGVVVVNRPDPGGRPDGAGSTDLANRPDRQDRAEFANRFERTGRFERDQADDGRRSDGRRFDSNRIDSDRIERDGFVRQRQQGLIAPAPTAAQAAQGLPVTSPPPRQSPQPGTIVSPPPPPSGQAGTITSPAPQQPQNAAGPGAAAPTPLPAPAPAGWPRAERREQLEELRRNRRPMPAPAPGMLPAPSAAPSGVPEPASITPTPAAPNVMPGQRFEPRFERAERSERPEREHRGGWERPAGGPQRMAPPVAPVAAAPAPAPAAPAVRPAAPPPAPVMAAPRPAPPAVQRAEGRPHMDRGRPQQER